jgi:DNA-binding IclR family transcriptional regulator
MAEEVIERGLGKVARNTITDPGRFRSELRAVRSQGYAYDDFEFADDMRCVAVPVVEKDGSVLGGISLSGPASRYTLQRLKELRDHAIEAANALSARLGGA